MTPLELRTTDLQALTALDADRLDLRLVGSADAAVEVALGEMLGRVHGEALRAGVREVTVDIRALEFMNSSCFKSFITWIVAVRRLPGDRHYKIRFLASAALPWQKRSLHAISHFGGDLVNIEAT